MDNKTKELREVLSALPENMQKMAVDSIVRQFLSTCSSASAKNIEAPYVDRPILPESMSGVGKNTPAGSATTQKCGASAKANRVCPSWFERDLRNNYTMIHIKTGAMFGLTNEEMSTGGWTHMGWVTEKDYPGIVKIDGKLAALAKAGTADQLSSFNRLYHLIYPNAAKTNGYNASEFWSPEHRKTLSQLNYACKKRRDLQARHNAGVA